ncbi:MAG TPA: vitamin K epoxide reductase family protein [Anaerolineales bacterium]|nr:vitamin K epoxide reductase family protein [Anaerolineales bacterium]HMV95295.1 vitamin K epoxide reductase family protein [Anaerolineales bacterium]HMX18281.1 vitamin K epoxide reductase family protein [Anaerolineales bacterium]HMX74502.1 vitamin K epoxide reductase family protein [Anaerolineales bacterium]HMZ41761.1 vitamin K epoxide reductase family protein [Anaerolineales bacterium]
MDKWLYRASVALVVLGLLVSIYMTIYKYSGNDNMCLGSGDCHTVNASRYSEVNGIPVAVFGIGGYLAILAVLYFENRNRFFRENATLMVFGMALTGFLFTVWLIYVEIALLKAICPFCVTSQVSMTLIFILAVWRLIRQPQS